MQEVFKRLYDVKETAATLSISTKSVRNLVKRGLLKPNRSLGKLLFSAAELDKFTNL
jgi:DNA-directed RNA polymerase specialized sigma24 family protein